MSQIDARMKLRCKELDGKVTSIILPLSKSHWTRLLLLSPLQDVEIKLIEVVVELRSASPQVALLRDFSANFNNPMRVTSNSAHYRLEKLLESCNIFQNFHNPIWQEDLLNPILLAL